MRGSSAEPREVSIKITDVDSIAPTIDYKSKTAVEFGHAISRRTSSIAMQKRSSTMKTRLLTMNHRPAYYNTCRYHRVTNLLYG